MNLSRTRGKRKDIREVWAEREKAREERGRPGMFQGTNYVTGAQLDAQDAQRRELEMQTLKNKGQFDVADRTQTGGLAIADRQEIGATKRTGLTEGGALQRLGQELQQRKYESDQDFKVSSDRLAYEQEDAQDKNRLRLFEHLDKINPITGQSEFGLRRDNYNLYSMTPEAKAAIAKRTRHEAALKAFGTDLKRGETTADMHKVMQAQNKLPTGPDTSVISRSPGLQRIKKFLDEDIMITSEEYDRRNRY